MNNEFQPQPHLSDQIVRLQPLKNEDFETLYQVASDPKIWEQHPIKDRYKREVFQIFFEGAMASGGAFIVYDQKTGQAIGSTRFYDWQKDKKRVTIGYTFYARDHWGGRYNPAVKALMLNHAFQFVDEVHFHVGALNIRSQKAIERLGALKIEETEIAYHGEQKNLNFIYRLNKTNWAERQ